MSLTYETADSAEKVETIEWDNLWMHNARDCKISRLLMLGDSITQGIRETLNDLMHWQYPADSYTTSKALDSPQFLEYIRIFYQQEGYRNAIVFNNGLHGWHLDDETEYAAYYERTVSFLYKLAGGTPLFLSLCTHLKDERRNDRVIARNKVIKQVAKKFDLPIIDLYTITKDNADLFCRDGVHFSNYRPLCEEVLRNIEPYM